MSKSERYLSITETAKALGVSTKALRLYEKKGLVKPTRSEAGWRFYGAEALTRLHQVLALKSMGLELSKIARLLKGSLASLDSVLALQEENLATRQAETYRALDLVRRARSRLSSGEALSVDDLTTLTRETIMDVRELARHQADSVELMEPYLRKYFTPEELDSFKANREQAGWWESYADAFNCLETAMKTGDETSTAALDAARRFRLVQIRVNGGDFELMERSRRMWEEAIRDPKLVSHLTIEHAGSGMTPTHIAFLERATKALEAKEAEAARKRA